MFRQFSRAWSLRVSFAFLRAFNSRGRTPAATCALLCLLAVAAACSGGGAPPVVKTPSGTAPPRTQFPMPPVGPTAQHEESSGTRGFTLMDNRRVSLSDYAGYVVVLDFYATWCQPCREETPHLVELYQRYGAQELKIIGLNVGGPDDRDRVPDFINEYQIPYTLGFPDYEMARFYLSDDDRIPQAFVFDRQGNLVKRFISYDSTMPAELENVIRTQLGNSN